MMEDELRRIIKMKIKIKDFLNYIFQFNVVVSVGAILYLLNHLSTLAAALAVVMVFITLMSAILKYVYNKLNED